MLKTILKSKLNDVYLTKYGLYINDNGCIYTPNYEALAKKKKLSFCTFNNKYKDYLENFGLAKCLTGWLNDLEGVSFSIVISFSMVATYSYEKVMLLSKLKSFGDVENNLQIYQRNDGTPELSESYVYDYAFIKDQTIKDSLDHFITLCLINEIILLLLSWGDFGHLVFFNEHNYRVLNIQDNFIIFEDSKYDPLLEKLVSQIDKDYCHSTCGKYFEWGYKYE